MNTVVDDLKRELISKHPKLRKEKIEELLVSLYENQQRMFEKKNDGILLYEKNQPILYIAVMEKDGEVLFEEALEQFKAMVQETKEKKINYALLSLSGFKEEVYELEEYRCRIDDWGYLKNVIEGEEKELLPHNKKAFREIKRAWEKKKRICISHATGTGKTYLAKECIKGFKDKEILVLAPSNTILEQYKSLVGNNKHILYKTYQKLSFMKEKGFRKKFGLIILDEFHRIGAENWGEAVHKLLNENKKAYVLGLSATPVRYLDKRRDMSEEFFKNELVSHLSLEKSIAKGILPVPKYITAVYTLDEELKELKTKIEKSRNKKIEKKEMLQEIEKIEQEWEKTKGISSIIQRYLKKEQNKFIVFTENKDHLKSMKPIVIEWFQRLKGTEKVIDIEVKSGEMKEKIEENIKKFVNGKDKKTIYLLFCINMLNEGFHVKDVSGIIMLRKTRSPIIFYQQLGRALQTGREEQPVIYDFVNNFKSISYQSIEKGIKRSIREEKQKRNALGLSYKKPEFIVYDETKEVKKLFQTIQSRLIQSWGEMYLLLKEYKKDFGNTLVPHDYMYEGRNLGNWVGSQRALYGSNKLEKEKVAKLNKIQFVWDLFEYRWLEMYGKLQEYVQKYHHAKVPERYVTEDGLPLGSWIKTQRNKKKKGNLSKKHLQKLNEVGFKFQPNDEAWEEMFDMLKIFKKEHGHVSPIREMVIKNKNVGAWVEMQRYLYKNKRLSKERIEKLNKIGFVWDAREKAWNEFFEELKNYKKKYGDTFVPSDYESGGLKLGNWVTEQRVSYKKGILAKERIERLESIHFIWNHKEEVWNEMFDLLTYHLGEKKEVELNKELKQKYEEKYKKNKRKLQSWMSVQRQFRKKGVLKKEKIDKLDKVGFTWDPHQKTWDEMLCELKGFIKENNHSNVPYTYKINGKKLGQWVCSQKSLYKRGELSEERIKELKKLNFKVE